MLLNDYATDTEIESLVNSYDFYIFPVVNPDGIALCPIFSSPISLNIFRFCVHSN